MQRKRWVLVGDLKRKIDLALEFRLVTSWEDLAIKLTPADVESAVSPKTIRWWIQGSANHYPGDMPEDAFRLFADLLGLSGFPCAGGGLNIRPPWPW